MNFQPKNKKIIYAILTTIAVIIGGMTLINLQNNRNEEQVTQKESKKDNEKTEKSKAENKYIDTVDLLVLNGFKDYVATYRELSPSNTAEWKRADDYQGYSTRVKNDPIAGALENNRQPVIPYPDNSIDIARADRENFKSMRGVNTNTTISNGKYLTKLEFTTNNFGHQVVYLESTLNTDKPNHPDLKTVKLVNNENGQ